MKAFFSSITYLLLSTIIIAQNKPNAKSQWKLDKANSKISFNVEHMGIAEIDGKFSDFNTDLTIDLDNIPKTFVALTIFSKSVNTGNDERDQHLRSHDFFHSVEYPTITFKSLPEGLSKIDSVNYNLKGILTIKNVSDTIEVTVKIHSIIKDLWGKERIGFKVKGLIHREKFGLTLNTILEQGILAIGKEVEIKGSLQFSR